MLLEEELKQHREKAAEEQKIVDELVDIISNWSIWKPVVWEERISRVKKEIEDRDFFYNIRASVAQRVLELPRYKNLSEREKIKLIMRIGCMDER